MNYRPPIKKTVMVHAAAVGMMAVKIVGSRANEGAAPGMLIVRDCMTQDREVSVFRKSETGRALGSDSIGSVCLDAELWFVPDVVTRTRVRAREVASIARFISRSCFVAEGVVVVGSGVLAPREVGSTVRPVGYVGRGGCRG